MTALVIAEHDNASIKGATLNTVTAAAACGGDVHVLVAGANAGEAAKAASQIAGVAKVIHADGAHSPHGLAENVAAQVLAIAGNYSHILFPATASGKNIAPRVAAKLDVAQISDITKVDAADTFERPIYAGNAIATVQSADKIKVITVRTTGFDPAAATGGSAAVETARAVADSGKSSFVGQEIAKNDRPELTAAKIIVSGGRAMGSSEKFHEVLEPLADKLGAAIGASRAAVDAGYAPNDLQVGQTGKIVAPQLYIACGISGRDPAPGRHEGLQGDRGDQQGPGSADLQRGRLRPGGRPVHGRAGTGEGAVRPHPPARGGIPHPGSSDPRRRPIPSHGGDSPMSYYAPPQGHAVRHRAPRRHRTDRAAARLRGSRPGDRAGRAGGMRAASTRAWSRR